MTVFVLRNNSTTMHHGTIITIQNITADNIDLKQPDLIIVVCMLQSITTQLYLSAIIQYVHVQF